jgi:uncharacterized membrane protein
MKKLKQFFTWLFFHLLLPFKKRQPKIKAKIEEVTENYQELINEFELIQKKESKLSKSQRDEVIQRVAFLIMKGHIKVNRE